MKRTIGREANAAVPIVRMTKLLAYLPVRDRLKSYTDDIMMPPALVEPIVASAILPATEQTVFFCPVPETEECMS